LQETIQNCWWKSGLLPTLCKAPLPRNKRKRQRLAPLNHGEVVVIVDDPNVAGPSNPPVAELLAEADEEEDDGITDAYASLDVAILSLSTKAVLDDGDCLITWQDFVNVPGEGSREDTLSDAELVALVVHGAAQDAADPDEAEEPLNLGPRIDAGQVANRLVDLTEYFQCQDWVNADDLSLLARLLERHQQARTTNSKQGTLGFSVVPKPF
jgi:hypothetical protein